MSDIVVTGATGTVGEHVVRGLLELGKRVRIAVPDAARARERFGAGPSYARLVFGEEASYREAFAEARALFLVRPPQIADVEAKIIPALEVAKAAGIAQVVLLSLQGVERNRFAPHCHIEDHLEAHGPGWTFLRPSFFMQNLATTHAADIRDRDEVFVPAGRGRTGFIDARDVAAVAVRALSEPGHEGRTYELTGAEALSYEEVARILSEVLGRPIRYADPPALRFWRRMRSHGHPASYVAVMIVLYTVCRLGLAARLTPETERLLGRSPIRFERFARDYARCWEEPRQPDSFQNGTNCTVEV